MRLFTSPRITLFLQKFRPPEGEPISAKVLNKSIETAQKRVEQRNYTMRKHTLEYDDVMNKQREEIYAFRNEVLRIEEYRPLAEKMLEHVCMDMASRYFVSRSGDKIWNPEGYRQWLMTHFPVTFEPGAFDSDYITIEEIEKAAADKVLEAFRHKMDYQYQAIVNMHKMVNPGSNQKVDVKDIFKKVIQSILVRSIDTLWQEHLHHIEHLRTEVNVRSIGQKDPLLEFKHEAFALFHELSCEIKVEIGRALFKFEMIMPEPELPKTQTIDLPRSKIKKPQKVKKGAQLTSPMIDLSLLDEESK
jgi:preprotein translocase subunit SecA